MEVIISCVKILKDLSKVDDKSAGMWMPENGGWQTVKWKVEKPLTSVLVLIVVHWWFSQTRIYCLHAPWNDPRADYHQSSALLLSNIVFKKNSLICLYHGISVNPRMVIVIGKLMINQQIRGQPWITSPRDGWGTGAATPSRAIHNRCLRAQGWKRSLDIKDTNGG